MDKLDLKILECVRNYEKRFNKLTIEQVKYLLEHDRLMDLSDRNELKKMDEKYIFDLVSIDYHTANCGADKSKVYLKFR